MASLSHAFLLCSERSGSNLIRVMLDAHSEVFAPQPIHLGSQLWHHLYRYGDLKNDQNWKVLIQHVMEQLRSRGLVQASEQVIDLTEGELLENVKTRQFKAVYDYVYEKGMKAAGKVRLFIKENHTYRFIATLLAAYPDAKFVYQVRDPRDFAASCKKSGSHYGGTPAALDVWAEDQRESLRVLCGLTADRVLLQRYEDLVSAPEPTLKRVCAFLGIAFEERMLKFHDEEATRKVATQNVYWENLARPVFADSVGRFRSGLGTVPLWATEHRVGPLMKRLGYEPVEQAPGALRRLLIGLYDVRWTHRLLHKLKNPPKTFFKPDQWEGVVRRRELVESRERQLKSLER